MFGRGPPFAKEGWQSVRSDDPSNQRLPQSTGSRSIFAAFIHADDFVVRGKQGNANTKHEEE